MHITELRELAVKEEACAEGLQWLDDWIKDHPKGTASQFFKSQRNVSKSCLAFTPCCYLMWSIRHLLDWSEVQNGLEHLQPWGYIEALSLYKEMLDTDNIWAILPKQAADALARAYK